MKRRLIILGLIIGVLFTGCGLSGAGSSGSSAVSNTSKGTLSQNPVQDAMAQKILQETTPKVQVASGLNEGDGNMEGYKIAYFAGGCFWGMEKFMSMVPGVVDVVSGYANGDNIAYYNPTYDTVLTGKTGYKESVKVTYDPSKLDYEMLVRAYYIAIDPTVSNRQGNDIGEQYQTGIYYLDDEQKNAAVKVSEEVKAKVKKFAVIVEPFANFFDAEEYHQDYLVKNPLGYCHISNKEIEEMKKMFEEAQASSATGTGSTGQAGGDIPQYEKPSDKELKKSLTMMQYEVTQNSATEPPFRNEYWNYFEKGIYVDIATGEPLFSSTDKYESSCGWPAFSYAKNEDIQYINDFSHGMIRTEVRSGAGDSHLGHVFKGDPESPSGVRYCINSASIRFVPYEKLDEEGYGYTKEWFE